MTKNESKDLTKSTSQEHQVVIPLNGVKEVKWMCDVCGHANPEYTAQCKKCSNYLQRS